MFISGSLLISSLTTSTKERSKRNKRKTFSTGPLLDFIEYMKGSVRMYMSGLR